MKPVILVFLLLLPLSGFAADSTLMANPVLSARTGVVGAACSRVYERGITAAGVPLICFSGIWKAEDVAAKMRVTQSYTRTPADDNTTKVNIAYCPVGWKAIGGDCNYDGDTRESKNELGHTDGDRGYWCFFSFRNAYSEFYGFPLGVSTTADCVRFN